MYESSRQCFSIFIIYSPSWFLWLKVDDGTMMIFHMRERARWKYLNTEKLHVKNTDARIKLSWEWFVIAKLGKGPTGTRLPNQVPERKYVNLVRSSLEFLLYFSSFLIARFAHELRAPWNESSIHFTPAETLILSSIYSFIYIYIFFLIHARLRKHKRKMW